MSANIITSDFKSSVIIDNIQTSFNNLKESSKDKLRRQVDGVFSFSIKNSQGDTCVHILDLGAKSSVLFNREAQPNVSFYMLDTDFVNLAQGKLNDNNNNNNNNNNNKKNIPAQCTIDVFRSKGFYVWKVKDQRRYEISHQVGYDIQAVEWKM